jgi:hypothetical protein
LSRRAAQGDTYKAMTKLWLSRSARPVRRALCALDGYRVLGWAGFVAACATALYVRHDVGITLDEMPQIRYGRRILAWFASGFRDHRAVDADPTLARYGGLFDGVAQLAVHFTPSDTVGTRHATSALCAVLGLVATWKMAESLLDRRAALVSASLLALTPLWIGHGLFNPKDIPFATAAAFATYAAQRIVSERGTPSWRLHLGCGVALGAALGVRSGGMFLLAYPLCAWLGRAVLACRARRQTWSKRALLSAAGRLGACWLTAWLCMLVAWPWAQVSPLAHPLEGAIFASHSSWGGAMLFDGGVVQAQALPRSYLPLWFAVTLPETYWLALCCALLLAPGVLRRGLTLGPRQLAAALLLMAAFGPPLAAVLLRPTIYDAQRHFLFVLPPLAALAGVLLTRTLGERALPLGLRSGLLGALLGLGSLIALDSARLHPYEYVYFNRLVGGLPGAEDRYETDYWGASYTEGLSWLAGQLDEKRLGPVRVATCNHDEAVLELLREHPELSKRVQLAPSAAKADILLATTRNNCHKSEGQLLHVVQRMGVPFLYVLQRHALTSNGPMLAKSR